MPAAVDHDMHVDVVVIGAGQGGLSTAYHLRRFAFAPETGFVVLDADTAPGGAWRHRARSLTMAKVHGIFRLPGAPFEPSADDDDRPVSDVVSAYFGGYERHFALPVHRPVSVRSVSRDGDRLLVETDRGTWEARAVVNATGTWTRPYRPSYPGAATFGGTRLHYADYRGPEAFAGKRVIVVGGGHSAMHVLSEIGDVAARTTWVTRRPPAFRDEEFTPEVGRHAVALVAERVRAGLPPQSVVSVTGLTYTKVVRQALAKGALDRLPMFDRLAPVGAEWDDGRRVDADVVIWCTGFRPAVRHLAPLRLREHGGGIRVDGTRAVREPRLHLVGYGASASTIGANRAGREAARGIRDLLEEEDRQAA